MFDFDDPAQCWTLPAHGRGMPGLRNETAEAFADAMRSTLAESGPKLTWRLSTRALLFASPWYFMFSSWHVKAAAAP